MASSTPVIAYVLAGILAVALLGFGGLLLVGNVLSSARTATLGWRVVDVDGRFVGGAIYDDAQPFSEGLAAVAQDGRWGFVDPQGQLVIPTRFDAVGPFSEGRAGAKVDGAWGVIDSTGAWVREPDLDRVGPFVQGVAVCTQQVGTSSSRITSAQPLVSSGLLDHDGQWILPPRPKADPQRWRSARGPDRGRVLVELDGGWQIFDTAGRPVHPARHPAVNPPAEGVFAFQQGDAWGLARLSGEALIPPRLPWVGTPAEGLVPVGLGPNEAGYLRLADGSRLQTPALLDARAFREGLAPVLTAQGWGFIDSQGQLQSEARWRDARAFGSGRAPVLGPDGWVLIDRQGSVLAGPFNDLTPLDGGVAFARVPRG